MEHVVMKHRRTTLERAEKFISTEFFTDVNLQGRLFPRKQPATSIHHWAAPAGAYTTFEQAVKGDFSAAKIGDKYGPTWTTLWFIVKIDLPADWVGCEARLKWKSGSEAMVWLDGQPKQGLSAGYDRFYFPLAEPVQPDNLSFTLYIEMACNEMFGAGENGLISPADPNKYFTLSCCEAVVFDRKVYALIRDIELLYNMAKHLPKDSERGYQALYTMNDMINACDVNDKGTFKRCHDIANKFLSQKNGDSQHTIHAMGHSHIDTAWLWPYSETIRKCARSWSCTLRLMEKYPDFTFTCSQAQQYEWVKQRYPELYADIHKYVKAGRFVPVGGAWVEMDGNIPSGEAFVRQFLLGQKFFKKEFGITCKEFWLPDTFGYSAQLPQIMRHCGITRFLTQKLSWNLVNKFPHHTFWWEGIDGSRVLAHFPPGDNYCMTGEVEELLKTANNFQDKGRSDKSVFLFGFGDGGNGPSEDMLERLQRVKDVAGLPRVKMSTPDEYFGKVEAEDGKNLCHWAGELYLELHNGTYTTQAKVKKMNRKCEFLLQDVEFLCSVALFSGSVEKFDYPKAELLRLWKLLLLNQFHDVLPGSSITMVYEDAHRYYDRIVHTGTQLKQKAAEALFGTREKFIEVVWNTQGWKRSEVIAIETKGQSSPAGKKRKTESNGKSQTDSQGNKLVHVTVPSYGYSLPTPCDTTEAVNVSQKSGCIIMENEHITAQIDSSGRVVSLSLAGQKDNLIHPDFPANQFVIFDDVPLYWDAWDVMDYHLETRKPVSKVIEKAKIIDKGPLRATVQFSLKISEKSQVKQTIALDVGCPYIRFETEVSWHESHKFLKVEFPTNVHTREVTYEIQYGHLQRPNHYNTSWDSARFEVCGHKWAETKYGRGVAVLNNSKYGFSAINNILRMSLLRAPKAPDNKADMETHTFTYALMPHKGSFQEAGVIEAAYNLNNPLFICQQNIGSASSQSYFSLSSSQVVLEAIKKAEDDDSCLVLRLYEAFGGRGQVTLSTILPFKSVKMCSGLEEPLAEDPDLDLKVSTEQRSVEFKVKPFQIVSLLMQM